MAIWRLKPVGKDYLWGGEKLKTVYGKDCPQTPLAETWEFAAHPDGCSVIINGAYQGWSLQELFQKHPEFFGLQYVTADSLPILIKLIDAQKPLSVQVHPDDKYAELHEHQRGKTEMWYILDAEPGAVIAYGFKQNMNCELLKAAATNGTLEQYLHFVPAHAGDVFYLPAGTVHGLGAGLTVLEVQENSNVTYRLYDYNRIDRNGQSRPLHIEQALAVAKLTPEPAPRPAGQATNGSLCMCPYFNVNRHALTQNYQLKLTAANFTVLVCVAGKGEITDGSMTVAYRRGDTLLLPYGTASCQLTGEGVMIEVQC